MKDSFKRLLRNRSYVSYWFATAFSMGASNVLQFTLALYVLKLTGSPTVFASMLSIIIIPRILLTPLAGILADRKDKIHLMRRLNLLTVLVMLAFFALAQGKGGRVEVAWIYLLVVLLEVVEVFYQAPESSVLVEIIDKDLLEEATVLARIDDGIVYISTPLLAAGLYSNFGITGSFLAVAGLLALSLVLNFFIQTPFAAQRQVEAASGLGHYWQDFRDGLQELRREPYIKNFVLVAPWLNFSFSAVFQVVITYLLLEVYQVSEYVYGTYRAVTASMVLIIPLVVLPLMKKLQAGSLLKYGSLSISISLGLIGLVAYAGMSMGGQVQFFSIYLIAFLDCITIASIMPVNMATQVFFQKNIKDEFRGRIMSVSRMLTLSSIPLGNMFYGLLADYLPAYVCILLASLNIFLIFLFIRSQEAHLASVA